VLLGRVKEFRDFSPVFPRSYARARDPHDRFERVVAVAEAGNPAEDFLLAPKFT
jgi:hypothetical protein